MSDKFRDPTQKMPMMPNIFLKSRPNLKARSAIMDKSTPPTKSVSVKNGMSHDPKAVTLKAGLYLVATPIGNLRDMTFRALDVLSAVDIIVCEDTRVTGKLMSAYGFKKKM